MDMNLPPNRLPDLYSSQSNNKAISLYKKVPNGNKKPIQGKKIRHGFSHSTIVFPRKYLLANTSLEQPARLSRAFLFNQQLDHIPMSQTISIQPTQLPPVNRRKSPLPVQKTASAALTQCVSEDFPLSPIARKTDAELDYEEET